MEKTYKFGDDTITAPEDLSVENVRNVWMAVHPALENAQVFTEEDGTVTFRNVSGTKG